MALRILGSKTVQHAVSDREPLFVGPFKKHSVRVMADVLIYVRVLADEDEEVEGVGYPISDLAWEDIEVPSGHILSIVADEPGAVWLTEF